MDLLIIKMGLILNRLIQHNIQEILIHLINIKVEIKYLPAENIFNSTL